jgi:hypothetical protein
MLILGGIAFTLIALVILAVFMSEYSKEAARKAKERDKLRATVEEAMAKKDLAGLKRIRLMNASQLDDIDKGLGQRLDQFADELYIEQDDDKKARATR